MEKTLKSLYLWIRFMFKILRTDPKIFFQIISKYIIQNILFHQKKEIKLNLNEVVLYWPNEHGFFYTAIEVFRWKLYKKLVWCNHVLDLWWYLWESAVRLAQNNKQVTVVEANNANYYYLQKNTKWHNAIMPIHWAITYQKHLDLYYHWNDYSAWWKISSEKSAIKVNTIDIQDIFWLNIDWIKMDIEWGEYDIISYLMTWKFTQLKKWYIEFHSILENREQIEKFFNSLKKERFVIHYENIYWVAISEYSFFKEDIAVIYFEQ